MSENLDKAVASAEELSDLTRTRGALVDHVLQAASDSWLLFLRDAQERDREEGEEWVSASYARGLETKLAQVLEHLSLAPSDVPELEVRRAWAVLTDETFPALTPEEPDPGRDWSRVEAAVFTPGGKYKYSVWLDYSNLREAPNARPGVGPSGWHYDGHHMARIALRHATHRGTSKVTFSELRSYHMFVPAPPQGYPHWIKGTEIGTEEVV